jgi:hypothetical protein
MPSQKSKWIIFTAAIACIGCCAVPLYLLIAGASSLGMLAALMNKQNLEVLICFAPLVLIAGYFIYQRHQAKKICCSTPAGECSSTQCGNNRVDVSESK